LQSVKITSEVEGKKGGCFFFLPGTGEKKGKKKKGKKRMACEPLALSVEKKKGDNRKEGRGGL